MSNKMLQCNPQPNFSLILSWPVYQTPLAWDLKHRSYLGQCLALYALINCSTCLSHSIEAVLDTPRVVFLTEEGFTLRLSRLYRFIIMLSQSAWGRLSTVKNANFFLQAFFELNSHPWRLFENCIQQRGRNRVHNRLMSRRSSSQVADKILFQVLVKIPNELLLVVESSARLDDFGGTRSCSGVFGVTCWLAQTSTSEWMNGNEVL